MGALIVLVLIIAAAAALIVSWDRASQRRKALSYLQQTQTARAIDAAQEEAHALVEASRQAREEMEESFADVRKAMANLREHAEQIDAQRAAGPTPVPATPRKRPSGAAVRAILEMKAAPPDRTRREGYWNSPPAAIAGDAEVDSRLRAVSQLGQPVEICFTGWTDVEKAELHDEAVAAGCIVRTNVAHHLTVLCVGETPGPVKMRDAAAHAIPLISGAQFDRHICGRERDTAPF